MSRQSRPTVQFGSRPSPSRGGPPFFLLTGLIAGLVLGLLAAWLVFPAQAEGGHPVQLATADKDQYRAAIALAFASSGDLARAEARLALLEDPSAVRALRNQAQLQLLEPEGQRTARALDQLADALEGSAAPEPTAEPSPTPTPEG